MIKTIGLFKNIDNLDEFEQYYVNIVLPKVLKIPGVIKMDITSLLHSNDEQPEGLDDICLIVETYFESLEVFQEILESGENLDLTEEVISFSNGQSKFGIFMGKEKTFYAQKWMPKRPTEENIVEIFDLEDN
jgi:hypothetical protein